VGLVTLLGGQEKTCPTGDRTQDCPASRPYARITNALFHVISVTTGNKMLLINKMKVMVKNTLEQATKAQRVNRSIALLFL
jgi:hypothetical protein